jgi:hypothetical protein
VNESATNRPNRPGELRRSMMAKTFDAPLERPQMAAEIVRQHVVRRWLAIGIVTLLLACGAAAVAVRWFSRLNPVEKSLVGDWSFATIDPRIARHLRLERDRTFVIWSSNSTTPSTGTWKASGRELLLSLQANFRAPPRSFSSWVDVQIDRLQHPQAWADFVTSFTLEEVTAGSARLREPDGSKMILRRVASPRSQAELGTERKITHKTGDATCRPQ